MTAAHIAAAGIWPAIPLTGYWLFRARGPSDADFPLVTRFSLWAAIGLVAWSVPLLVAAAAGVYRGELFGLLGWLVTAASVPALLGVARGVRARGRTANLRSVLPDLVLVVGLAVAGALYFAFPAVNVAVRDEAVYANHGIYIAREGRLDVPYPWPADAAPVFEGAYQLPGGLEPTRPTMLVQFAHLFPVWLAQAFATLDERALFRLNGALALLALAAFYGLARQLVTRVVAVVATLFLAFNVSQVWVARITLSEIMAQWFILAAACLLVLGLRHERPDAARAAGVLFGAAALARVDAFLLLPLLFLGHVAGRLFTADRALDRTWMALYQTALPSFGLALVAYLTLSQPYFSRLGSQLAMIGGLTVATALLLLVLRRPVLDRLRPIATGRAAAVAAIVALVGIAAWAYWIRPVTPPFEYFTDPISSRFGARTYAEESLVNIGRYLSPLVVGAAVAGVALALWRWLRSSASAAELALLVMVAGVAAVYLWQPSINPGQFWAVRRFVPLIIPGFVLFAAFAVDFAGTRLRAPLAAVAGVATVVFLAWFTVTNGQFVFGLADFRGHYSAVRSLAAGIPEGEVVMYRGVNSIALPLILSFDRQVVPLDLYERPGRQAFQRWVEMRAADGKPALLLSQNEPPLVGYDVSRRIQRVVVRRNTVSDPHALPTTTAVDKRTMGLYEIRGRRAASLDGVNLVRAIAWGVDVRGVLSPRSRLGPGRWTTGEATFVVPVDREAPFRTATLRVASTGPAGSRLQIFHDDRMLLDRRVGPGAWTGSVALASASGPTTEIRIVSDVFVTPAAPASVLGIQLMGLELSSVVPR